MRLMEWRKGVEYPSGQLNASQQYILAAKSQTKGGDPSIQ